MNDLIKHFSCFVDFHANKNIVWTQCLWLIFCWKYSNFFLWFDSSIFCVWIRFWYLCCWYRNYFSFIFSCRLVIYTQSCLILHIIYFMWGGFWNFVVYLLIWSRVMFVKVLMCFFFLKWPFYKWYLNVV